ncbi:hypothetical protein [Rhodopirellula sp. P2]|uniref:hypothetical protein n=1 Tax=Rhodopirellula sp. P2 TaxID=2127060 RepID=UPI002367EA0E|nr:hypothetical protein [Rhodopirellula sp. P2]WDQ19026.1 hypothetical protein PSR62_10925 [Rhodopirellula sp. P2]
MPREENLNELETFLRKSAEIRQRNAIEYRALQEEQRQQRGGSRPRQYSDRNRERVTRQLAEAIDVSLTDDHDDDDIVIGEVVDDRPTHNPRLSDDGRSSESEAGSFDSIPRGRMLMPAEKFRRLLSRPGGAQQAFLMSEILKRREI